MALLFHFDKNGRLTDETAYQVREFRELIAEYNEETFRYVALVCDYESPFWQHGQERREELASRECFGHNSLPPKDPSDGLQLIKTAMQMYCDAQYDHIEEQLRTNINSHYRYNNILNETKLMDNAGALDNKAVTAIKTVQDLMFKTEGEIDRLKKKVLERRQDETRSRGDKRDSWLSGYLQKNMNAKLN